jgi:hypothetical protein
LKGQADRDGVAHGGVTAHFSVSVSAAEGPSAEEMATALDGERNLPVHRLPLPPADEAGVQFVDAA